MASLRYVHPVLDYFIEHSSENADEKLFSSAVDEYACEYDKELIRHYYTQYLLLRDKYKYAQVDPINDLNFVDTITGRDVEKSVANCPQIILEVTEKCNMACRYCIYGESYSDFGNRTGETMGQMSAIGVVDYMLNLWKSNNNTSPLETRYVGFYGGEPLLNFSLINTVVKYIDTIKEEQRLPFRIAYTLTTNASKLQKHIDFLIKYDFELTLSLDGGPFDNANRVWKDGSESFSRIITNIIFLKNNYPEFFNNNVHVNAVYSNVSGYYRVKDFFESNGIANYKITELNPFHSYGRENRYYKSIFSDLDGKDREQLVFSETIIDDFVALLSDQYLSYADLVYNDKRKIRTGTCLPFSRKLFLTVQGQILPCEAVPHIHALGSVDKSGNVLMDYEAVSKYYNKYYAGLKRYCKRCYRIRNCKMCFLLHMKQQGGVCPFYMDENKFVQYLVKYISYLEKTL